MMTIGDLLFVMSFGVAVAGHGKTDLGNEGRSGFLGKVGPQLLPPLGYVIGVFEPAVGHEEGRVVGWPDGAAIGIEAAGILSGPVKDPVLGFERLPIEMALAIGRG